jgi:mRNA degradation ribonuclease J1/J2
MRELRETRCARARPIPTDSVRACCYAVAGHGFTTGKGATHHIIHRGRHEIGGMCIEVAADDGTRILLDLGMPLQAPDGGDFPWGTPQRPTEELIAEGVLVDVPGVFPHDPAAPGVAAIVLTHSHLDHYGLAHHAHPAIPVYGSTGTLAILDVGRVFFPNAALPSELRLLPTDEPHFVHSGGHAWPEDLDRLVAAIDPEARTWVHTDAGESSAASNRTTTEKE